MAEKTQGMIIGLQIGKDRNSIFLSKDVLIAIARRAMCQNDLPVDQNFDRRQSGKIFEIVAGQLFSGPIDRLLGDHVEVLQLLAASNGGIVVALNAEDLALLYGPNTFAGVGTVTNQISKADNGVGVYGIASRLPWISEMTAILMASRS